MHIQGARGATLNDQLITAVGTHDFSDILPELYTTSQASAAADAAETVADKFTRAFVLPTAADGAQFAYLDRLVQDYDAHYETILLRDHSWYDKQVQLTPAFQALLSITVGYLTGGAGAGLGLNGVFAAGFDAALASTITGVVSGAITGDIDMDMILRGAILAGVGASISSYLTQQIDLGDLLGASDTSPFINDLQGHFSPGQLLDRLGDKIVSNGVTNVLNGQDFFEGLDDLGRTFLVTETLGVLQFGVGELGAGQGDWEGSLPHMLLHGGLGCVAMEVMNGNCASGFFAGLSQSALAGSSLTDEQKIALAPLVGAMAGFFWADGEAVGVTFGSTVVVSGLQNNYLTHQQVDALERDLAACVGRSDYGVCREGVFDRYEQLSETNRAAMLACTDVACWESHRQAMIEAQAAIRNLMMSNNDPTNPLSFVWQDAGNFAYDENGRSLSYNSVSGTAFETDSTAYGLAACGGVYDATCMTSFQSSMRLSGLVDAGVFAIEVGTPWGTIVDGYECASRLDTASCLAAAISLVPVGTIVRAGGRLFIRTGAEFVPATQELVEVATSVSRITLNREAGAEFERQVIAAFEHVGGLKNTTPVTVTLPNGKSVTTVPDLWGTNVGGMLEVKNVQNLSMSDQLRAQIQAATRSGQPLNLVVSPRTQTVSGPLVDGVRSTGGEIYVYDPASDTLTLW